MPQYALPQCPGSVFTFRGSDSDSTRYKVLKQIVNLINEDKLRIKLPEGFSAWQLVEITKQDLMAENEDKIIEAVKVLNKLSTSKQKMQELNDLALQARSHIDVLFTNKVLTSEDFKNIEEGLRTIKDFAQANLRYKEALPSAEKARSILDEALRVPEEQI